MTSTASAAAPIRLAGLTTIGLGGPAPALYPVSTAAEVAEVVGAQDSAAGALILGGGSNLVVADEGVDVPVVKVVIPGVDIYDDPRGDAVTATLGAGVVWDDAAAQLVAEGFGAVAPLSGIPGSVGATPVQNVGAYGAEIAEMLLDVEVYDRAGRQLRRMAAAELALAYRSSILRGADRAVVTQVRLRLRRGPVAIRYAELARALGLAVGGTAPGDAVREAVLNLRRAKGMVLDPADPDTRSVGSFFTNPIVGDADLARVQAAVRDRLGTEAAMPRYPATGGTKLSAAWLIERAGFGKGYPHRADAPAALSSKHTLALTNRGGTTADLIALARVIRGGVAAAFGVTLEPEPILVGVAL